MKVDQCQPHEMLPSCTYVLHKLGKITDQNSKPKVASFYYTYTKPSLDPPKGILFPANLGLVLT